jgi:antitoxin component YwqK of YwqJK toxin-antitoxin module
MWYTNGQLSIESYYNKQGKLEGEYKEWCYSSRKLIQHKLYKDNEIMRDFIEEDKLHV